jgi:hypothetical protein
VVLSLLQECPFFFLVLLAFSDSVSLFVVVPLLEFFLSFVSGGSLFGLFVGFSFDDSLHSGFLVSGDFFDASFFFERERLFIVVTDFEFLRFFDLDELASEVAVELVVATKIIHIAVVTAEVLIPRIILTIYPAVLVR